MGLFIRDNIKYKIREDLGVFIPHVIETLFVEIINPRTKNVILGVVYRPNSEPYADVDIFSLNMQELMNNINAENKSCVILGDMNVHLLKFDNHRQTNEYLDDILSQGFVPVITEPTRIGHTSASLIDHIYINDLTSRAKSGIIITDVADHFCIM